MVDTKQVRTFLILSIFLDIERMMNMAQSISPLETCPMALGINILSGKWTLRILWLLYNRKTVRFNELQRSLENITTKTLTGQLKALEEQKIILRVVYPEVPPKVEYSLTELGETLKPVFDTLCQWGQQYLQAIDN